jgi:radical SAM superfamily enzyme YgiQ (UPF0313 family)
MKIKIIFPTAHDLDGRPIKTRARIGKYPNLSFLLLAGLTPSEHEVDVIDDLFEDPDYDEPVDLVGITAMTSQATRAYEIAAEYRKRGVKVVMGGYHATFVTEEAVQHVDAVVTKEGDLTWPEVIRDVEKGKLERIYHGRSPESLAGLPAPRYDLVQNKPYRYSHYIVWAGRGCPHNCDFCSVTRFHGSAFRTRPVDDILRDISLVPTRNYDIVDDNFFAYKKLAQDLLPELEKLRRPWGTQVDPGFAQDNALIERAAQAGLQQVFIGFESVFDRDLGAVNKGWARLERDREVVRKLHDLGILVHASMIFGINPESIETVRETLQRLEEWQVDEMSLFLFTPGPGTRVWERLVESGSEFSRDWRRYNGNHAVIAPEGMGLEELEELYWKL